MSDYAAESSGNRENLRLPSAGRVACGNGLEMIASPAPVLSSIFRATSMASCLSFSTSYLLRMMVHLANSTSLRRIEEEKKLEKMSVVIVASSEIPVKPQASSHRNTDSRTARCRASRPATTKTLSEKGGITGSCPAGHLRGYRFAPSASTRTRSKRLPNAWTSSKGRPVSFSPSRALPILTKPPSALATRSRGRIS